MGTQTAENDLAYKDVFSDSEYSKAHKGILQKAKYTDFRDKASHNEFESYFNNKTKVNPKYRETLLHRVAKIKDEKDFNDCKGPDLVRWVVDKDPKILEKKGLGREATSALHIAIEKDRLAFLNCILDFSKKELEHALAQENLERDNCLHAAIEKRLLCTKKLVAKCNLDTIVKQSDNAAGCTPLHLLMEKQPTARNAATARAIKESVTASTSRPKNPDPAQRPARVDSGPGLSSNTSKQRGPFTGRNIIEPEKEGFDPAEIMETMISQWKSPTPPFPSKAAYITTLMTAINSDGESPYQVRERKVGKDPKSKKDRDFLERIRTIIMTEIKDISLIGKALYGSEASEYELCLDMSDFNRSSHDFTRFIKKLKDAPESDFKFLETLFYLTLPDLNTFPKPCHEGVREFFAWLKNEKRVNIINDLKIPDSATNPLSEELVKEAIIDQFEIEKLDWRKLDVSLDILTAPRGELGNSNNTPAPEANEDLQPQFRDNIKELTLYSSGNWSVLYHWASEEGLKSLGGKEGLRSVKIKIVELDPSSDKRSKEVHEKRGNYLKEKLTQRFKETGVKFNYEITANTKWDFPVLQISDDEQTVIPQLQLFQNLAECQRYLFSLKDEIQQKDPNDWTAYARRFHDRPIRVAVLDNGADKIRSTLKQHIEKGVSFVSANMDSDNRILPWWMVADPHGTQMASLITSVNPFCRLYIARVGTGRKDILPERAAQAVKWAIEQKVDVLSLSWITRTNHEELEKAIKLAAGDNAESPMLIFSSTADEGIDPGQIFPAAYNETFSVAATDRYGHVRPASQKGVDILVPGEDISADGPVYMQKFTRGTVTGSSVATALAAGIASLALLMLRVFNEEEADIKKFLRKGQMMGVFQKMQKTGSGHHGIQVSQLFEGRDPKKLEEKWRASPENFPVPKKN